MIRWPVWHFSTSFDEICQSVYAAMQLSSAGKLTGPCTWQSDTPRGLILLPNKFLQMEICLQTQLAKKRQCWGWVSSNCRCVSDRWQQQTLLALLFLGLDSVVCRPHMFSTRKSDRGLDRMTVTRTFDHVSQCHAWEWDGLCRWNRHCCWPCHYFLPTCYCCFVDFGNAKQWTVENVFEIWQDNITWIYNAAKLFQRSISRQLGRDDSIICHLRCSKCLRCAAGFALCMKSL